MTDTGARAIDDAPLLRIDGLNVEFGSSDQPVRAVNGVDLEVRRGETLGIIGESGSGKSVTAMSILRLLPKGQARITSGKILFDGTDLLTADPGVLRRVRGKDVSIIFQDPATSLHPSYTIGAQLIEAIRIHDSQISKAKARARAAELIASVGIAHADERLDQYPHQFSGGMRQRCMIAMAIANQPQVVIADEPTTALDVTIQAEILNLLRVVQRETDSAVIFITHDLRVVAQVAERVAVMYAGSIVESGKVDEVFQNPQHPYTSALLRSLPALDHRAERQVTIQGTPPNPSDLPIGCAFQPRCDVSRGRSVCITDRPPLVDVGGGRTAACHFSDEIEAVAVNLARHTPQPQAITVASSDDAEPVLSVTNLDKKFEIGGGLFTGAKRQVHAVNDVSFDVHPGKTLALVGESGSGKSTTARLILRLHDPTGGKIMFGGRDLAVTNGTDLRNLRREIQVVFQDPFGSLNPRLTARELVAEPLKIQGLFDPDGTDKVGELLGRVGLSPSQWNRLPAAFSGGQRQRIAIARALILEPKMLVLDEAVSALDVSIQAQVLNLLADLQAELGLTYLFISHDLAVVRQLADSVAVMFAGRIVEQGAAADVYGSPRHPYTRALLAAIPGTDPHGPAGSDVEVKEARIDIADEGCAYRLRCPIAQDVCTTVSPPFARIDGTVHDVACHFGAVPVEVTAP
ncbi:MAG: ABC transporter ATP-binding protein [Ilumatobacteraceae bacterium]|nr:ABC transporter ATP-binding protein [Ilumatobacteraceae bacterium]